MEGGKKSSKSLHDWRKIQSELEKKGSSLNSRLNYISEEEVAKHNKKDDCWMILNGKVFDVTQFIDYHPGGGDILLEYAGKDATKAFQSAHSYVNIDSLLKNCQLGTLIKPFKSSKSIK